VDAYQRSLLADSEQSGVYSRIGLVLILRGKVEEARVVLEHEMRRGTADALTHYNLGHVYELQKEHNRAAQSFERAVAQAPDRSEPLWRLSQSLKALGRDEEAQQFVQKFEALKGESGGPPTGPLDPDVVQRTSQNERQLTAETWHDASELLAQEVQRLTEALAARSASDMEKVDRTRLSDQYRNTYNEMVHALNQSLQFDDQQPERYLTLLAAYRKNEDYSNALKVGQRALKALPNEPALLFEVGGFCLQAAMSNKKGRPPPAPEIDAAIGLLTTAVELQPDYGTFHLGLANAIVYYKATKELIPLALIHAKRAMELTRDRSPQHYRVLSTAYYYAGDNQSALATLRDGVSRFPGDTTMTKRLRLLEGQIQQQGKQEK